MNAKLNTLRFLLILVFVIGCQEVTVKTTATKKADSPLTLINATATAANVETTQAPPMSSNGTVIYPKINIPKNISDIASGRLFYVDYDDYKIMSLDLQTMNSTSLIPDSEKMDSYALSPNGEWLSYKSVDMTTATEQLVIRQIKKDADIPEIRIPWENDWDKVAYWLTNEQVIIKMFPNENYRVLLFNPLSGERRILSVDFPNLYSLDRAIDWNGSGQFIYNSTLTRVVYADLSQNFVMWDVMENKQLIAKQSIAFGIVRTKSPQWTLDGSKVIFAAPYQSLEYMNDELFAIDQDGSMEKLTDMASIFSAVSINRYSWSPDNRYIAMLFSGDNNDNNSAEQLAVLDVYSQVLNIYCIEEDNSLTTNFDYRRSPKGVMDGNVYKGVVWSPDSRQLIIENRFSENSSRIVLIDVDKQDAYEILNNVNYLPVGWTQQ